MDIREEFEKWIKEQCYNYTDWHDLITRDHEISFYIQQTYEAGYKSRDKEIEELSQKVKREQKIYTLADKQRTALKAEIKRLRDALEEISEPEGVYSLDPLQRANNCISSMISIAKEALKTGQQG